MFCFSRNIVLFLTKHRIIKTKIFVLNLQRIRLGCKFKTKIGVCGAQIACDEEVAIGRLRRKIRYLLGKADLDDLLLPKSASPEPFLLNMPVGYPHSHKIKRGIVNFFTEGYGIGLVTAGSITDFILQSDVKFRELIMYLLRSGEGERLVDCFNLVERLSRPQRESHTRKLLLQRLSTATNNDFFFYN